MTKATHANFLKLTYSGNDKYTVTWHGWPIEGSPIVRRIVHSGDVTDAATQAGYLFADWLQNDRNEGKIYGRTKLVESITCGDMPQRDATAVMVVTKWVESN